MTNSSQNQDQSDREGGLLQKVAPTHDRAKKTLDISRLLVDIAVLAYGLAKSFGVLG